MLQLPHVFTSFARRHDMPPKSGVFERLARREFRAAAGRADGVTRVLFDTARHEPLAGRPWDEAYVRAAVRRIADDALAAIDAQRGHWPAHPLDDPERPDPHDEMLYSGAGGMLLALARLAQDAGVAHGLDVAALLPGVIERLRVQTQAWGLGDGGGSRPASTIRRTKRCGARPAACSARSSSPKPARPVIGERSSPAASSASSSA
jgi:hypothetical protein